MSKFQCIISILLIFSILIFTFTFSFQEVFATYGEIEIAKYVILKAVAAAGITFTSMSAANEYYESFIGSSEGKTIYHQIKTIESQNRGAFVASLEAQGNIYNEFLDWSGAKDRADKIANIAVDMGNDVMDFCRDFADVWLQGMGIKKDFETGNYSYDGRISISVGETYHFSDSAFINSPSRINVNGDVISLVPVFKGSTDEGDPYFYFHFYSEEYGQEINTSLRNYYKLGGVSCNTYQNVIVYDVFYTYKVYVRSTSQWVTKTASKRFASSGRNYLPDNSISFYPDLDVSINNNYIKENIPWENTYSGSQSINVPLGYDNLFNGQDTLPPIWWDDILGKNPEDIRTENPSIPADYPLNPDYPYNPARPGEVPIPVNPDIPINPPWVPDIPIPVNPSIPGEGDIPFDPSIPFDPTFPTQPDIPFTPPPDIDITPEIGGINWGPLIVAGELLATKFPFSLPWDFKKSFESLAIKEDDEFKIEINFENDLMGNIDFDIDFSKFNNLFLIVRSIELLLFDVGLILLTRNLMGGDV